MNNDDLLIEISSKVAAIQVTVENIKEDIQQNKTENTTVAKKLEDYFEYAKNRQDSIKRELSGRIDSQETRITALEQVRGKKLLKWWDWGKDKLTAALLVLIGVLLYKWLQLPPMPKL